jgi:hypothetical protein
MSAVSCIDIFDQRTGAWTTADGRRYTRVLRVITNAATDGPAVAIGATGINRGDQYFISVGEQDPYSYCQSMTASQEEGDALGWIVIVEYGPYGADSMGGGPQQNPLLMPIDVKWTLRDQAVVVDMDINGNTITNTAGDPFDPPLEEDDPRPYLTVVRNEPVFNLALMQTYRNAINTDQWAGFPPLMAKVYNISPSSQFHQDAGWYYQVTYEFEFLYPASTYKGINGYRRTILSQGWRAISVVSGNKYQITYKGLPVTEPCLLDKNGYLINTTSQQPYWCVFQTKPELAFTDTFQFDPAALTCQRTGFQWGYGSPFYNGSTPWSPS